MRWSHALLGLVALTTACVSATLTNINAGSSVHFKSSNVSCTAFHIGEGQVLTAAHCLGRYGMFIEHKSVMLKWANRKHDVALFFVPGMEEAPASALACRDVVIGERVVVIADTGWETDIYTFGWVSSRPEMRQNDRKLVLLDLVIAQGNSGAPVYATDGRIIAMVIGMVTDYGNMGVAVPGSVLCALIEGHGEIDD